MRKLFLCGVLAAAMVTAAIFTSCDKDEAPYMLNNTTWAALQGAE